MSIFSFFGASPTPVSISISQSDLHLSNAPTTVTTGTVGSLLSIAYFLAGIVAVLVIIIGGIRYAAANGDSSQITAAKNMILYAVVGLIIVIMAAAITQFILQNVAK
ncbi:MAG TPA: hypothetical protein VMT96_00260 [Candidatus Bathyarchaeia archaeon]|nr:hypothetical protein [Candidatus Bathyarchaeia archaeon]